MAHETFHDARQDDPDADRRTDVSGVASTAAIAGHPIHPVLIPLPIGALVGVIATDLAFWFTGDTFWARGSWWLLWAGLVTGVLAAVVGLIDFATIARVRSHAAGRRHAVVNGTVLVLTGVNLAVRASDVAANILPWGLGLTLVTGLLLAVGGWYGGELAYRHGIGVTGH